MKNKKRKSFLFSDVNKSNAVVAFLITFGVFAFTFLTSYALFSSETEGANSIGLKASDGSSCYNNGEYLQDSPGDEYEKREGTLTLGKQQTSTTAPDSEKNEIIGNGTYYRTKVDGVWGDWTTTTCDTTDTANCEKFTGYIYRPKLYVWCVNKGLGATFTYTGSYQKWTVPATGYYYVELNGASGGTNGYWAGYAKGARTTGYIKLNKGEVLYIYVGQQGSVSTTASYNGGGKAGTSAHQNGYSGGGATDIRYFGTSTPSTANLAWNSTLGLNSRIMVAAGGGGAYFGQVGDDSAGGTIWGVDGGYYGRHENKSQNGKGAKQTAGGAAGYNLYGATGTPSAGTFGVGGDNNTVSTGWVGAGGGGGGYYGGGAGGGTGSTNNTLSASGNGGGSGSSFISGYAGVDAITSSSSRTATNNTLHYSGKYFVNAEMLQGLNKGNGSAKISYVGPTYEKTNTNFNGVRYIKDCVSGNNQNDGAHWSELQAIVNGKNVAKGKTVTGTSAYDTNYGSAYTVVTDGVVSNDYSASSGTGLQCVTVDLGATYNLDEIAVWHYFYGGRDYKSHSLYTSSNNSTWRTIIDNQNGVQETSNGIRANAYEEQTEKIGEYYTYHVNSLYYRFTAQSTGYYKVELKGASGGKASTMQEGYGARTEGYIKLNKGDSLYVYVGGKGNVTSNAANQTAAGGYNGGGSGYNNASSGRIAASGGGATDIRSFGSATPTAAQLIWNSTLGLNARIMVAAGAGGSWYASPNYKSNGANGGLIWGSVQDGTLGAGNTITVDAATQVATQFGYGVGSTTEGTGGGGGYYGGNKNVYANGGGSSFISGYAGVNAITSSSNRTHTYNTLHYTNKYFVDGMMFDNGDLGSGEGRAVITYIGPTYPRKNKNFDNVRYIKDCINGNSVNSDNNWNELQAIINGKNVAKGKTVTVTATPGSGQSTQYLVDGYLDVNSVGTGTTTGLQCVTVDLGTSYDLDEIAVWHYFIDGRSYNNHSLYTSSDNSTWRALISNESGVAETSNGIRVNAYEATGPMISDETPSVRIKKGTAISDYMTGISAVNMNGDDITSSITHTTIDTSTSGKKTVTYTVTDSGMTTTHQRTYTVYDITLTNANATVRVKKGSTINYLSGITGTVVPDNTDVTSSVTYNKIDTSTDGTKTVTYTLSYGGLVKTVTRTYVVYSQYVIVGSNPDYTGNFQTRSGSYMFAGTWSIASGVATQVTSPVNWTNAAGGANASTSTAIDLTDYKKLSFQVTSVTYLSKGRIGLSKNLLTSTSWVGDVAENNSTTGTTEKFTAFTTTGTYTIDVSSMTGKYYINFGLVSQYTNSTNKATVKYTNVYLE